MHSIATEEPLPDYVTGQPAKTYHNPATRPALIHNSAAGGPLSGSQTITKEQAMLIEFERFFVPMATARTTMRRSTSRPARYLINPVQVAAASAASAMPTRRSSGWLTVAALRSSVTIV